MGGKSKVSITVDSDTLREVDSLAGEKSRSQIFEQALISWVRHHRKRTLVDETEAYYRSLGQAEREEDREWAELAAEGVKTSWDERRR